MMPQSDLTPSRKDQILIYCVLGWAVCGIFSFVSYNMAKQDLMMIASGEMEDRDVSTISLLKTVSLVQICLMAVGLFCVCLSFMMQLAAGTGGGY